MYSFALRLLIYRIFVLISTPKGFKDHRRARATQKAQTNKTYAEVVWYRSVLVLFKTKPNRDVPGYSPLKHWICLSNFNHQSRCVEKSELSGVFHCFEQKLFNTR